MSGLPQGWCKNSLSDCANVLDNMRVPVNSDDRAKRPGDVPYYGATGQVGWIDNFLFDEELLLIGEDGAPFFDKTKQIAYLINGKSWVNNHAHVLKAKAEITSNRYLKWYLDWFDFHDYVNGTTRLKLTQGAMNRIPVLLPPLNEQRRIVAKLEALLSRVDACKQRLARIPVILKRFRQAVLAAACSGRLTADWRELNNLDDWEWSILSQQDISIQTGPFGSALHKHDYVSNGFPLVNPMHIHEGQIYPNANQSVSKNKLKELTRYVLGPGDIVLGRRGEMGRAAVVRSTGLLCGTGSLFLRTTSDKVVPDFLCLLLRSPQTCAFLEEGSVGSTMTNLNQQIVGSLAFPITSPDEQQEIVSRVEGLFKLADQLEARYTVAQAQVDKLTQSILAKAFQGELVPQDPNDEPAEKLLERIREQRNASTSSQKKQKKGGKE